MTWTEEEILRQGCIRCGDTLRPVDRAGQTVPSEQATDLLCDRDRTWYDPTGKHYAIIASAEKDGGERIVSAILGHRARQAPVSDPAETLALIAEHRLSVYPWNQHEWMASWAREEQEGLPSGRGRTIGDAVRACVERIKASR